MSLKIFHKTLKLFIATNIFKDPYKRNRVIATLVLLLIDVVATSLLTYSAKIIIDSLALNKLQNILHISCLLGICLILTKVIVHIQEIILFPVINLTIRDVTYKVIKHLHNISLIKYQQLSLQEVINSIRRISISARTFIKTLVLTIVPAIMKLCIATAIIINCGVYSILWLWILIISTFILYKSTKWYIVARKDAWQITDQVIARINDSIINTKTVRAYESTEMEEIMSLLTKEAQCWQTTNAKLHWAYIKVFIILGISITLILIGVIYYIEQAKLTVGDFIFLKAQLINALAPFKNFSVEFRKIAESLVDISKIIDILEIPKMNSGLSVPLLHYPNKIIFVDNITFAYPGKGPIFTKVSMPIFAGEKIIITGKNGSGKSTLINLITGLYKPTKGQIFIRGQNIQYINKQALSKIIYCVQQDFRLFNNTLFYNITYGINNFTKEQLNNIVTKVTFVDFIKQLPLGLDTVVGDMGSNFSIGEKQKIAILKALLIKPEILILDEATNSLSVQDEQYILNLLCSYIPTIIIVSHRTMSLTYTARTINMKNILDYACSVVAT